MFETMMTALGLWFGLVFVWGLGAYVYYSIYHARRSLKIARAWNR